MQKSARFIDSMATQLRAGVVTEMLFLTHYDIMSTYTHVSLNITKSLYEIKYKHYNEYFIIKSKYYY